MDRYDSNRDGKLDYEGFTRMLNDLLPSASSRTKHKVFNRADADGDGCISYSELEKFTKQNLGYSSHEPAEEYVDEVDANRDGCFSYDEFSSLLSSYDEMLRTEAPTHRVRLPVVNPVYVPMLGAIVLAASVATALVHRRRRVCSKGQTAASSLHRTAGTPAAGCDTAPGTEML
mmetsp:Transcript_21903/g.56351  ORF Transcript_21903/g.56351 Transcript_21903/m.56351 type:complete len:174 (-) Transcript_21903:68-589(-)